MSLGLNILWSRLHLLFCLSFFFFFFSTQLIIQKVCTWLGVNLQIYGGGNHMSRLHGLNTCSRTCQCVWSSYMPLSLLLGIFFFFHIDLLPPSDSSYFLYHMTTHCSISPLLALSIALSLSLSAPHTCSASVTQIKEFLSDYLRSFG